MIDTNTAIIEKAETWLSDIYDDYTREEVKKLIKTGGAELVDSFYKDLEFGTGGMRGIMGVGTNRINKYTLGMATQGLSNYLKKEFANLDQIKVAIAHDCRINSKEYAEVVANIFSANGIKVFLFEELRPTPELSFAIRHLNCQSGIVLTASHNPKEYNGYKVYFNDGAQLVPPHDGFVIDEVRKTKVEDIQFVPNKDLIQIIGQEVDNAFTDAVVHQSLTDEGKDELKIVFTSLHGTSIKSVPDTLSKAGFKHVSIVKEQAVIDGNFPTVDSPNPEEQAALKMAIDLAEIKGADILIGTDPDADRIGIGVRDLDNNIILLNGNQTAAIMTWFLLKNWKEKGKLTGKEYIAQTIVTSHLIKDIADGFDVKTYFCLTGFKWIAEIIRKLEGKETFIGGGEESYGYMIGDFVRDKDAVSATLLACEIAAWAKANGSSLFQELLNVYKEFGFYKERLISIVKKGKEGAEAISQMMEDFRKNAPETIDHVKVAQVKDYRSGISKDRLTGEETKIDLPSSNVIQMILEDGSVITARPSGTEPKIKFYISVKGVFENYTDSNKALENRIDNIINELKLQ